MFEWIFVNFRRKIKIELIDQRKRHENFIKKSKKRTQIYNQHLAVIIFLFSNIFCVLFLNITFLKVILYFFFIYISK